MDAIQLKDVSKTYLAGPVKVPVLHDVSLEVPAGRMTAIMGPSGSGKSTLMNIIGLLDRPTRGELCLGGEQIHLALSDRRLAAIRSERIGFVFQSFNLLPKLSALDNVLVPTAYRAAGRRDRLARAKALLKRLGLGERMYHKPPELSGGEKQRVAIARALINDPEIILADEPTGNLDSKAGHEVMRILGELCSEGKTVVVITHDATIAEYCDETIHLFDGRITKGGRHA